MTERVGQWSLVNSHWSLVNSQWSLVNEDWRFWVFVLEWLGCDLTQLLNTEDFVLMGLPRFQILMILSGF